MSIAVWPNSSIKMIFRTNISIKMGTCLQGARRSRTDSTVVRRKTSQGRTGTVAPTMATIVKLAKKSLTNTVFKLIWVRT